MFAENSGLNGQYTVVGQVVSGMDVVDKLKKGPEADNGAVTDPGQDSEDAGRRRREVQ